MAVRTGDGYTRSIFVYAHLIIREAQKHGGSGWLEYDCVLRQQAALNPSVKWNELYPRISATTYFVGTQFRSSAIMQLQRVWSLCSTVCPELHSLGAQLGVAIIQIVSLRACSHSRGVARNLWQEFANHGTRAGVTRASVQ